MGSQQCNGLVSCTCSRSCPSMESFVRMNGDEKPFLWKRLKRLMIKAKSFPMLAGSSDSTPEVELTSGEEWSEDFAFKACDLLREPFMSRFSSSSISKVVSLSRISTATRFLKSV